MRKVWIRLAALWLLALQVNFGCAFGLRNKATPGAQQLSPAWIVQGSGAFATNGRRQFYGVGHAVGIKNAALAKNTAENRARAEIARAIEVYSAWLMKNYLASIKLDTTGDPQLEADPVDQAIKALCAACLSQVQVVDHWVQPVDGSVYAMARLDVQAFVDSLVKIKDLSAQLRDYVRNNAADVHTLLQKQRESQTAAPRS